MNNYEQMTSTDLLDKLEYFAEEKQSASSMEQFDYYCEEISKVKKEIVSRIV